MTNYLTGHKAEQVAADYLKAQGYSVLQLNWRTKYCEIDIVAKKSKMIYFIEVKYRKTTAFGSGLEYITPKKVKQMTFAAETWVTVRKWTGDYQLAAIEMSGNNEVIEFLTDF